jgi:hypothetical protein
VNLVYIVIKKSHGITPEKMFKRMCEQYISSSHVEEDLTGAPGSFPICRSCQSTPWSPPVVRATQWNVVVARGKINNKPMPRDMLIGNSLVLCKKVVYAATAVPGGHTYKLCVYVRVYKRV